MHRITPEWILIALRIALYAALFTPLLFAQSFIFPFVVIKTHVFQALLGVIAALYGAWLLVDRSSSKPRWTPLRIAVLAWFCAALLSSVFSLDITRSLWSTPERGLGLVAALHFMLFAVVLSEMRDHLSLRTYVSVSLAVSAIAALFAFVHIADPTLFLEPSGGPTGFAGRPGSFLGNPTYLASYLLPHIFLAVWLAVRSWNEKRRGISILYLGVIVLNTVVIFLTQTRGALLGLALGSLMLGLVLVFRYRSVRLARNARITVRAVGVVFLGLVLVAGAVFWFTRASAFWQSVPGLRRLAVLNLSSKDIQPRLIAIRISLEAFRERPVLGFGFENFKYAFDRSYDPKLLEYGYSETYFDKPHNVFLEHLVDGGIIGLVAYCAMFVVLGYVVLRRKDHEFMAPAILGAVAAHLGNDAFVFDTFGSWVAIFLVMGVVDAAWLSDRDTRLPSPVQASQASSVRTRRWFLCAGLGGAALLWTAWNGGVLYANNREYWVLNYFLNRLPERAIESYHAALRVPLNPFRSDVQRDFSSSVSQLFQQRVIIPNETAVAEEAMASMEAVVQARPYDYFQRVSYIDSAATLFPNDPVIMARSEQYLAEALQLSPNRQQIRFVEAKLRLVQGRIDEALAAMRKAIDLDPEIAESHFDYALMAFEAGKIQEGFAELETAERLGRVPRAGNEMRIVANQYADAGNYAKAISLYGAALGKNPDDLESRLKLGIVYFYAGDLLAARDQLTQVAHATNIREAPSFEFLKPIFDAVGVPIP
ncbi:MAG: hypothetical protein RL681_617 [Candidatus Parcubacteria bacterium]|jgi:O-antigen ligase/tetratricopeptide (TPR) repeat protein